MTIKNWDKAALKLYQVVGDSGDHYHRFYINPAMLKCLGDIQNKKILDLACGLGDLSRIVAKKGAKVTGVDFSEKMIKIAQRLENKKPLKIKYIISDAANLKMLKNCSFDIVISKMGFHNIKNISKTINECSRILRLKGKLIFAIKHPLIDSLNKSQVKKDSVGYYIKMRGYNNIFKVNHNFMNGLAAVSLYHRPLGYYFNQLFQAGFLISGFQEISIRHQYGKEITDKAILRYKKSFPSFLVIEGIKFLSARAPIRA